LIEDVLDSQKVLASTGDIELRADIPGHLPDILADRDRVVQVFGNLIGNAIKFTKPGGTIALSAEAGISEVVFSVTDTGPGIAERHLPHLFDRFWQASKGRGHGAGLGLAIVKGIVEAHGGRVWATSTPGTGSTFHFTIPSAPTGAQREPAGLPRSAAGKDMKSASGSS
jgi:signal transduction histidine kinase